MPESVLQLASSRCDRNPPLPCSPNSSSVLTPSNTQNLRPSTRGFKTGYNHSLSLPPCDGRVAPPSPLVRGTKRGYKNFESPQACGVRFQGDPVWLWTLRPKDWSSICIIESEWKLLRSRHSTTWERFRSLFEVVQLPIEAREHCHEVSVWWISGESHYIESLILPPDVGQVFWMKNQSRRWPKSLSHIDWRRITHAHVGGTTNARGTFGTRFLPSLDLPPELQRSITHVLKFSIRPTACSPDLPTPHYTLHDRLSLGQSEKPVLYPTYMSRSGWGYRSLSPSELGCCFDLPEFIEWDRRFLTEIVPLQLHRAVMDFVLEKLVCGDPRPVKCRKLIADSVSDSPVDGVWLTGLKSWLPGSWVDVAIADKAVKSDDALVDTRPWNKRISLVLPCKASTIGVLERFAMRRWRWSLITSFFEYLAREHGPMWLSKLMPPRHISSAEHGPAGSKRPHGLAFPVSSSKGGGIIRFVFRLVEGFCGYRPNPTQHLVGMD